MLYVECKKFSRTTLRSYFYERKESKMSKKVCGNCNHFPDCESTEGWRRNLPCTEISGVRWEKLNNKPIKKVKRILPCELSRKGGAWLGAARSWLQSNTMNGDRVTWGSNDIIQPHLTVKEIEDLAAHVAAAAINEMKGKK